MAIRLVARRDLKEIFPKEFSNRSLIGKFIDYIMNNFMQPSSEELINGYVGKKTVAMEEGDFYLQEPSEERQVYQLTPSLVSLDPDTGETLTIVDYCNFINTLKKQGCNTNDQNRLMSNKYWSWCPPINVDMFINYNYYYWVEQGPTPIELKSSTNANLDIIGKKNYTYTTEENEVIEFTNGLRVIFKADTNSEYNEKPFIIEGVGSSIQLVDDSVILKSETENPDYFIMERGCKDGNNWSRRNRWFHRSIVNNMSITDDVKVIQASRPIICFNRDIELYNYGVYNRGYVDMIYEGKKSDLNGQPAFVTVDNKKYRRSEQGIPLEDGVLILITGDDNEANNNIIYQVTGTDAIDTIVLQPVINGLNYENGRPVEGEGITVKSNDSYYAGQYFYYKKTNGVGQWVNGQKKDKENQMPLFNLYDDNKVVLNDVIIYPKSSFKGNGLFDYITPEEYGIEDTSKIQTDEYLGKQVVTTSYGNFIFRNLIDSSQYTYTDNSSESEVVFKGLKFYKINNIKGLNENGEIDYSNSLYSNTWHISNNKTSQYVTTEIVVTDDQEKVVKGEEQGMITYYTRYELAYKPDESETQVTSFVYVNGNLLSKNVDYVIETEKLYDSSEQFVKYGKTYLLISPNIRLKKDDYIYVKLLVSDIIGDLAQGYYFDLPLSLTANALNENIIDITYNECYDQMKSIMENQIGFEGNAGGDNNYIDTAQNVALGTEILQHSNPILKTMLLNSKTYSDVRSSIEFVKKEYNKFKTKFRNTLDTYVNDGLNGNRLVEDDLYTKDDRGIIHYENGYDSLNIDNVIKTILDAINIGKSGLNAFYNNGVLCKTEFDEETYYVPSSPAYLGLDKVYKPDFVTVESNPNKPIVLQCHDGSYGQLNGDFRDSVLLQLEERIYNSIVGEWKEGLPVWNNYKYIPGKFRDTPYSLEEYRELLSSFLEEWCNSNNITYTEHTDYDTNEPFTFNYSASVDKNDGEQLYGSYRSVYMYYYDTFEPNLKPWEMLGFGSKPSWWESHYGKAPYTSDNIPMWTDIENGFIADGPEYGYHKEFERKGLIEKYLPVDEDGNLLNPIEIGIIDIAPNPYVASKNWEAGDMGNVETVWTFTSDYRFAIQIMMYLMRPVEWVENNWNTLDLEVLFEGTPYEQVLLKDTMDRPTPSEIIMHNEQLVSGKYVRKIGIQQWISDFMTSENINITSYIGTLMRNSDLRLTYRCGRYYMKDSLKIISDNYGVLPSQNYHMSIYKSNTDRQVTYSAMVITKVNRGYMLDGFDLANPYFNVLKPVEGGKTTNIEINGRNVIYHNNWKDEVRQVKYKTIFGNIQELYDVICGYGKYLENVEGWVFDKIYEGNNEAIDFTAKGEDFVRFVSVNPEVGQLIMLNPGYEGMTIRHTGFLDIVGQYNNGQWTVLDTLGNPITNDELDVYRHAGYSEVKTKNRLFTMLKLNFVEYEHMLEFDNKTIYGDILYDPLLCVKTQRLKIMGTGVADWDGTMYAPGYLIEYDGATPNYDKLVNDFRYFYDTDDVRSSGEYGKFAKKTIGYVPLPNMERLLIDERNMFDFYKGLIREKGTRKSFGKLNRSRYIMNNDEDTIELYENWAFKLGEFGFNSDNFIMEFDIPADDICENPQIVTFTTKNYFENKNPTSVNIAWGDKDKWLKRLENKSDNTFTYRDFYKIYPVGGYAKPEDVNYIVENDDVFEENKEYMKVGETIWVVTKQDGDWDIYKRVIDGFISMRVKDISMMKTLNTDYLTVGDLIYVSTINLQQIINSNDESDIIFDDPYNVLSDCQNITDKTAWAIFKYNGLTGTNKSFSLYRCQNKLPDITKIDTCYIVDNKTDKTLSEVQLYDPIQGVVPNKVLSEVDYINAIDPCLDYDDYYNWGDKKVGDLWWDLSKVKYLDYHQGDVNYRRENWGKQLPGSEIAVMEWTKSNEKPTDGRKFITKTVYNYETANLETYYYYWEKNPVEIPEANFRQHSALHISQIINSPQDEGIIWMAPIFVQQGAYNENSFIIGNYDNVTTGSDFVVQINFKTAEDLDIHQEWAYVREGDDDDIPESLWKKMKSSLVGYTEQGLLVPDPDLYDKNRLGLKIRPMQTMFESMALARRNMIDVMNEIFLTRDVSKETDVGTPRFNHYFDFKSEEPSYDIIGEFESSDAMKVNLDISNVGKTIIIYNDKSYDGIWTLWKMNGVNDFELLDYEKYNMGKYYVYATLYKDEAAKTAQPVFTCQSLNELLSEYYKDNTVSEGDVFRIKPTTDDWALYRAKTVTAQNIWYNLKFVKSGYVNDGKAYDKHEEEVGTLVTDSNINDIKAKYDNMKDVKVNDIIYETTHQVETPDGRLVDEEIASIIGFMIGQNIELELIAKNNATIVLLDSLYDFLEDESLKTKEFIDGQTKYEYLLNETSILVSNILDYFDNEIDFVEETEE